MKLQIIVFLAFVAIAAGNSKTEQKAKKLLLTPNVMKFLYMYVSRSAELARIPFLSSFEPCTMADQIVVTQNKTAIGVLKKARLYGLHDFRLDLHLVPVGSDFRLYMRFWYRPLRAIGNVSLSTTPAIDSKSMFSNHLSRVLTSSILNITADTLKVEKVKLRPILGATIIDVLTDQPIQNRLHALVARAYSISAEICVRKAIRDYFKTLNKVLKSVTKQDALRGKPPVPITPRQNPRSVRKMMAFWRSNIRKMHLDPLQVPITVNEAMNVTAVFRGLARPPILMYAGIDPIDKARTDLIMQYPIIGADLDASLRGRKLRLHANVRDLMLSLQISNTDPPRVIDATDIGVSMPRIRNPRAFALRYMLRNLKVFIGRDLGQFIVKKFKQA